MAVEYSFQAVIEASLNSLAYSILTGGGAGSELGLAQLAIKKGQYKEVVFRCTVFVKNKDLHAVVKSELLRVLNEYANLFPAISREVVDREIIEKFASINFELGEISSVVGRPDMAYNLFEFSYGVSTIINKPALLSAYKLLEFSKPADPDQRHGAFWRIATEQVKESVAKKSDWLAAVDAVELALNLPVKNYQLRIRLATELLAALQSAAGTPIHALQVAYIVQETSGANKELREGTIKILTGVSAFSGSRDGNNEAREIFALVRSQAIIDDLRLTLIGQPDEMPSITWHDQWLNHNQLTNAVPLQRSLIVDVDRSGQFFLELVHEVTHAYNMIGGLGVAKNALKSVLYYCELGINLYRQGGDQQAQAESELPDDETARAIAEIQIDTAHRSEILQATWTPWLEGVSMYCELLCDPKDDSNEIFAIHEAVRSLIDIPVDPKPNENEEEFATRYANELVREFENFYAKALENYSSLRHSSYFGKKGFSEDAQHIYFMGYLVVRSVVARWEEVLGKKLVPVKAAKLLSNITRNATYEAVSTLDTQIEDYEGVCIQKFMEWIGETFNISKSSLETFFEEVEQDEKGHTYFWENAVPYRVIGQDEKFTRKMNEMVGTIREAALSLAAGMATSFSVGPEAVRQAAVVASQSTDAILGMHDTFYELSTLLPVGKDTARLIFVDSNGRVTLSPRTYVGLQNETSSTLDERNPLEDPRYSVRSFVLAGSAAEVNILREFCSKLQTSRVTVTRVIDLIGNPISPYSTANHSYVCYFMDKEWHRISAGDLTPSLGEEYSGFVELIKLRLFPPPFFSDFGDTIGKKEFLINRILKDCPQSKAANSYAKFDIHTSSAKTALQVASMAFGVSEQELRKMKKDLSGADSRKLSEFLYKTGRGLPVAHDHDALTLSISKAILDLKSFSGVKPIKPQ